MHENQNEQDLRSESVEAPQQPFRRWNPATGTGASFGYLFTGLLAVALLLSLGLILLSGGFIRLLAVMAALAALVSLAFVLILLARMRGIGYVLNSHELIVEWQGGTILVPYSEITSVVFADDNAVTARGYEPYWPGFHISNVLIDGERWRSVATLPPGRRIRIQTAQRVVAITPEHPVLFLQELEIRRREVATRAQASSARTGERPAIDTPESTDEEPEAPRDQLRPDRERGDRALVFVQLFRHRILGDSLSSNLLAGSVIVLVLMTVYSVWRIDGAFNGGPIHWDAYGNPDAFVSARGGWIFVLIAATILLFNTALATLAALWDLFFARLLLASTLGVQAILAVALLRSVT